MEYTKAWHVPQCFVYLYPLWAYEPITMLPNKRNDSNYVFYYSKELWSMYCKQWGNGIGPLLWEKYIPVVAYHWIVEIINIVITSKLLTPCVGKWIDSFLINPSLPLSPLASRASVTPLRVTLELGWWLTWQSRFTQGNQSTCHISSATEK